MYTTCTFLYVYTTHTFLYVTPHNFVDSTHTPQKGAMCYVGVCVVLVRIHSEHMGHCSKGFGCENLIRDRNMSGVWMLV